MANVSYLILISEKNGRLVKNLSIQICVCVGVSNKRGSLFKIFSSSQVSQFSSVWFTFYLYLKY